MVGWCNNAADLTDFISTGLWLTGLEHLAKMISWSDVADLTDLNNNKDGTIRRIGLRTLIPKKTLKRKKNLKTFSKNARFSQP